MTASPHALACGLPEVMWLHIGMAQNNSSASHVADYAEYNGKMPTKLLEDECAPAQEIASLVAVHIPLVATAALLAMRSPLYGCIKKSLQEHDEACEVLCVHVPYQYSLPEGSRQSFLEAFPASGLPSACCRVQVMPAVGRQDSS